VNYVWKQGTVPATLSPQHCQPDKSQRIPQRLRPSLRLTVRIFFDVMAVLFRRGAARPAIFSNRA
jgi:hypothetical protein